MLCFSKPKLQEAGKGQLCSPKGFSLIQGDFCIYNRKPQLCRPKRKKKKKGRTAQQMLAGATEFRSDDFGSDSAPKLQIRDLWQRQHFTAKNISFPKYAF